MISWLYTIVFAGMLISDSIDSTAPNVPPVPEQPVAVELQQGDIVEKFTQTYPLNPNGRVNISNINGSITVDAWDRNEVALEVTKIADSQETMALVEVEITAQPDHFRIETEYQNGSYNNGSPWNRNRRLEVQYRLKVPRGAVLNEIGSVNGPISLSNFTNIIKASAVNGSVVATNLRGTIKLSTVNGEVKAGFDTLNPGTSLSFDTVNGKVNIEVPSDINATVKADSLNGSITNEFGLPVRKGKHVGRDLHGRIGTGEVQIKMSAVNGGLFIGRKKDGKSSNPVTNLLKATDDDDEDTEEVSKVDIARANRIAQREMHRSTKLTEKALKDSHKDLEKMKPELEKIKIENIEIEPKLLKDVIVEGVKQAVPAARFSQALWAVSPTTVEQRSRSFDVKGSPKVSIEGPNCKIRVRGWDQQTVKYVLTESKSARHEPMVILENATENSVMLKVVDNSKTRAGLLNGERTVRLDVYVPRKTDIRVETEKEIRVEGVTGRIDLSGDDGAVSVRDSAGSLKLTSGDGLVRVVGFKGSLELEAVDGEVYLEGDFDRIESCASDAHVTLTIPADRNVSISTNKAIESEGLNIVRENDRTWRLGSGGAKYDFEFAEGHLVVRNQAVIETN
ncbi:MAG TPA: DUF4097 family beta strand repeat-containing protein [Pyrinomonadaceae bacterium]|nr:DUF4097 family beta strand repeat-containing protein [Pyrinomonadaceae bacterium]